jgi:hypothetical protein
MNGSGAEHPDAGLHTPLLIDSEPVLLPQRSKLPAPYFQEEEESGQRIQSSKTDPGLSKAFRSNPDDFDAKPNAKQKEPQKLRLSAGANDNVFLRAPGAQGEMIMRDSILPYHTMEKKLEIMLDHNPKSTTEQKKSCWSWICPCWKGPQNLFKNSLKKKKQVQDSILNILECLYREYHQELANRMWHKALDRAVGKVELRDDYCYWILLLV